MGMWCQKSVSNPQMNLQFLKVGQNYRNMMDGWTDGQMDDDPITRDPGRLLTLSLPTSPIGDLDVISDPVLIPSFTGILLSSGYFSLC